MRGALVAWDAGNQSEARSALGAYLESGSCVTPPPPTVNDRMRSHGASSYDYALLLRELEAGAATEQAKNDKQKACIVSFLESLAHDAGLAGDLRARAALVLGNLHYADKKYPLAIKAYDEALVWRAPAADYGLRAADAGPDDGTVEERAAYNRALALRQIAPPPPDGGGGGGDGGGAGDGGGGQGDGGGPGQNGDAGAEPQEQDAGPPQGERMDQSPSDPGKTEKQSDGRVLDALENAPMFELERMRKQKRKPRTTDK